MTNTSELTAPRCEISNQILEDLKLVKKILKKIL